MKTKSPFKFLDSYKKEDRDIFFGRDLEVEELYTRVFQSRLVVVYGASGTGKSSIINCGLANKFEDSDWLPVSVRRGRNINTSLFEQVLSQSFTPVNTEKQTNQSEKVVEAVRSVYLDHFKPIYLVFDQFEELFIMGEEGEKEIFIQTLVQLLKLDIDLHFIFVIRGEYLEYLSDFEKEIPEFFENRIRIEKISRQKALTCISGPAETFDIELEKGFEVELLNKINPDRGSIELTFLQIFLDRIYSNALEASKNGDLKFSKQQISEIGEVGDILADFLEEQIAGIEDSEAALSLLKSFVTLDGTKTQSSIQEAVDFSESLGEIVAFEKAQQIIQQLVNRRILNDKDESGRYELRHDSLASEIYKKISHQERELLDVRTFLSNSLREFDKRGALLNENDLNYISLYQSKLALDDRTNELIEQSTRKSKKQRRSRRTRIVVLSIISLLFLSSAAGFIYASQQQELAESAANEAIDQQRNALEQKQRAENQRALAEQSSEEARRQALIAEQERQKAESLFQRAEEARNMALVSQKVAESERSKALENAEIAERNAIEAEKQKAIAEAESKAALKLRMLALARSMAIKSNQLIKDQQSILLAKQALIFNDRFSGDPYQADVYKALYSARKRIDGSDFNANTLHKGSVNRILSDGEYVYSAGSDGKVMKWKKSSPAGQENKVLYSSEYILQTMQLSKDGTRLAIGSDEGHVIVINRESGAILFENQGHSGDVLSLAIKENGNIISAGVDGQIIEWSGDGTLLSKSNQSNQINNVQPLPGSQIIFATDDGDVILFDTNNGETSKLYSHTAAATAVAISPDQSTAAFGFEDGLLVWFDLQKAEVRLSLLGHLARVSTASFSDDGSFLVTSSYDRTARVWNLESIDSPPIVMDDHNAWVSCAAFVGGHKNVLVGNYNGIVKHYYTDMKVYAEDMCESVGRSFEDAEWNELVGEDIEYENTCIDED